MGERYEFDEWQWSGPNQVVVRALNTITAHHDRVNGYIPHRDVVAAVEAAHEIRAVVVYEAPPATGSPPPNIVY